MDIEELDSSRYTALVNSDGVDIFRKKQVKYYKIGNNYCVYGCANGLGKLSPLFSEPTEENFKNEETKIMHELQKHDFSSDGLIARFDLFPTMPK